MKKRNLVIGALASLGALAFLITAVLSPPTQEAEAQSSVCDNIGNDCFDDVSMVIAANGALSTNPSALYEIYGSVDGSPSVRVVIFDPESEAQKVAANRCFSLARRAQAKSNVTFFWSCIDRPCNMTDGNSLLCGLQNR